MLRPLHRYGIEIWHSEQILPGQTISEARALARQEADLILLLVSPDYLASSICEEDLALQQQPHSPSQIVPLLLRACLWDTTQLAVLPCILPNNRTPLAQWPDQDEALTEIGYTIARLLLPPGTLALPSLASNERTNRAHLITEVHTIWIKGFLEKSLHAAAHLALHLQDQPDALENPWRFEYQELAQTPQILPPGTGVLQVYEEAHGELLILGAPGAGKTTLLLELARHLLAWARRDISFPIPVIFLLSSWTPRAPSLAAWMIDELQSSKYQISRQVATNWIDHNQILPLLDGLDEVPAEIRTRCVQAINAFQQGRYHTGERSLVVCCRSQEYQQLASQLVLTKAVSIQPLTNEQIVTYLDQSQGQLADLQAVLFKDDALLTLVRQPLILAICALIYQGSTITQLPVHGSPAEIQQAIFAAYVERMISHRKRLPLWMQKHFLSWLQTIARHMQQQQQTTFSIEDLQADWLPKKYYWLYRYSIALITGLLFGLPVALLIGFFAGALLGPTYGIVDGLLLGIVFALLIGLPVGWIFGGRKIETTEVVIWSWKNRQNKPFIGLFFGLLAGALGWVAFSQITSLFGESLPSPYRIIFTLLLGLSIGLSLELFDGLSGKPLIEHNQFAPNEGTWRSAKNWLLGGLPFGLFLDF